MTNIPPYLLTYLLTYLFTPWCRVLLEKLTGLQLVKKLPTFHGTRRFITALTSVRHLSTLGQPNPVHIPTSHLLEIRSNIIRPSTPRSPQWSPSLRFPHQEPIHPYRELTYLLPVAETHLPLCLPSGPLPSGFHIKILYTPVENLLT